MERLTDPCWKNLDPWECCGQDYYCKRGCHDKGGCTNGCIVPKLYARLAAYEDIGMTPEEIKAPFTEDTMINLAAQAMGVEPSRLREIAEAEKDRRLVVMPCKVGERWADEDGRAVRITAVIVSIEPFGTNINIYFDYEDATPDDAGSDCVTNWDYFSRHYTCIEAERATEGATE